MSLIITPDSSSCSIIDGNFRNAYIAGKDHKIKNVTVKNRLTLKVNNHDLKKCKRHKLQDESEGSSISRVKFLKQK